MFTIDNIQDDLDTITCAVNDLDDIEEIKTRVLSAIDEIIEKGNFNKEINQND